MAELKNMQGLTTKENVNRFNRDVRQAGSYLYTTGRCSSDIANSRLSGCVREAFDFKGKSVLDLGCGDGTYTLEFPSFGATRVIGIDPAVEAVEVANAKAIESGLSNMVKFETGNIYELGEYISGGNFDCIILRGVLHHLPDPERAIMGLAGFNGAIILIEPNGYNPVLKLIEKFSRYHIEHEERSFAPCLIRNWLGNAGFSVKYHRIFGLVPFFCPDWMAQSLTLLEPIVERIPLLREISCGQNLMVAVPCGLGTKKAP